MPIRDFLFLQQLAIASRACWKTGLATFLLILTLVGVATAVWPRTYHSEARLYVRLGRETVSLDPTATTGQTVSLAESREREINSILELLRSRELCEKVVDELGVDSVLDEPRSYGYGGFTDFSHLLAGHLHRPAEPALTAAAAPSELDKSNIDAMRKRENAVRKLMKNINCSSPRNSNVILISCTAASPATAQQWLEHVLANYQEQHLRVNRISGSYAFFDAQLHEKKANLDAKLLELRDVKNKVGVDSIEGQRELLSQEALTITSNLLDAQAACAAEEARLQSLLAKAPAADQQADADESSTASEEAINMMRSKLYELEIEQQRVLAQFQPAHPLSKAINEQVAQAKALLIHHEVLVERSRIIELKRKVSAAQEQRAEVEKKLKLFNENEVQIAEIDRQVELLGEEYRKADENREQARTDEELAKSQISNINVAQSPSFSAKPTSPGIGRNIFLGIGVALLGALCMVFWQAVRKGAVQLVSDVEAPMMQAPIKPYDRSMDPILRSVSPHPLSNGV
ncbi:MAG: hypothetical protein U0872_00380 [Planctomycetaceae bacterium]